MDEYGRSREMLETRGEKLGALHIYLARKSVFYLCLGLLGLVEYLSSPFGFKYSYKFSDWDCWNWFKDLSIPRYKADIEKVD